MECKICKGKSFTNIFDCVVCDRCGAMYKVDEPDEIIDFEKAKLWGYFKEKVESIKDDAKKEYIKGLFYGYYDTLIKSNWKKAKEWAIIKIEEFLKQLEG